MRRHVIFVFIFVFWGLAVCTVLSEKIEEEMKAEVVIQRDEEHALPLAALFTDEEGQHLYQVVNGEGWDAGKRVSEVNRGNYWLSKHSIGINNVEVDYILYASKEIFLGELVEVTPFYQVDEEEYMVILSEESTAVPFVSGEIQLTEKFSTQMSVLEQKENIVLLSMEEGLKPFIQEAVQNALGISETSNVYNVRDVEDFSGNFPVLGGMAALLLASVMIWSYSWHCSKELKKNGILLGLNTGIAAGLFWMFGQLVQKIQFPSSLLPAKNIFRFGYYKQEFSEMFQALKTVSETAFTEMMHTFNRNLCWFWVLVLIGVVISLVFIRIEKRLVEQIRRGYCYIRRK